MSLKKKNNCCIILMKFIQSIRLDRDKLGVEVGGIMND